MINKKFEFINFMFEDLKENLKIYLANEQKYKEDKKDWELYKESGGQGWKGYPYNKNNQNKNHGRTVLKRKIISLRQELLNLERLLDK